MIFLSLFIKLKIQIYHGRGEKMTTFDFVTTGWGLLKPGIERAVEARIRLFEKNHWLYRLVTTELDLHLHEHTKASHIWDTEVVNLYDFFAEDLEVKPKKFDLKALQKDLKVTASNLTFAKDSPSSNSGTISNDVRIIKRVYFDQKTEIVTEIDTYDDQEHKTGIDFYDSRGFKAIHDIFDEDNHLISQSLFNSHGNQYFQILYRHSQEEHKDVPVLYQLYWQNNEYVFNGINELNRFFFDALTYDDVERHPMIIERTNELAWAALHMTIRVPRYMYLHSDHVNSHLVTKDTDDTIVGSLNPNYEYALNHLEQWDGVIMSTPWQKEVFQKRYGNLVPSYVIPVGYIPDTLKKVDWESRTPYKVICVARLSPEKQQEHLIRAFESVITKYPDARLELWGYDNGEKKKLTKVVKETGLENIVKFCGYNENTDPIYNSAQLSVLASNNEGFALTLLESISHGVPTIAYDAPYGAKSIITDKKDGFIVPLDNINELANKINDAFLSQVALQRMSENAYQDSQRYSESNVTQKWQTFVNDVENHINCKANQFDKIDNEVQEVLQALGQGQPDKNARMAALGKLERTHREINSLKKKTLYDDSVINQHYVPTDRLG